MRIDSSITSVCYNLSKLNGSNIEIITIYDNDRIIMESTTGYVDYQVDSASKPSTLKSPPTDSCQSMATRSQVL